MTLLYADDSAHLAEEEAQRYVLADSAGVPLIVFGDADADGVLWLAEEPQGWDAPTVALPIDRKQDGHGGYAGEQFYEERVLSVVGSAEAPSIREAHRARKRLVQALTSTVRYGGVLLWTHLDDEPAKSLWVEVTGAPRVSIAGRWIDYAFVLVAPDPLKHGPTALYGPVRLLSTENEAGRSYDAGNRSYTAGFRSYPGGSGQALTVARVANDGDEPAHAVYRITGPIPRPIVQVGTGEFVALGFDLTMLDTAVVDTDAGTVEVNGVNRYDAFLPGSTFPLIPSGGAEVRLRSGTGGTSQTAGLTIETAPRWT